MAYTIIFSAEAKKDVEKLDSHIKKRFQKKFIEFSKSDDIAKIAKKLVNHDAGQCRLRVGDYRIIFDMSGKSLHILRVRHRREVYK